MCIVENIVFELRLYAFEASPQKVVILLCMEIMASASRMLNISCCFNSKRVSCLGPYFKCTTPWA